MIQILWRLEVNVYYNKSCYKLSYRFFFLLLFAIIVKSYNIIGESFLDVCFNSWSNLILLRISFFISEIIWLKNMLKISIPKNRHFSVPTVVKEAPSKGQVRLPLNWDDWSLGIWSSLLRWSTEVLLRRKYSYHLQDYDYDIRLISDITWTKVIARKRLQL